MSARRPSARASARRATELGWRKRGRGTRALDLGARLALRAAYRAARLWWWWHRPLTHGALVAVWVRGRLLVVENSYRRGLTLPGGFVERGEQPRVAAARELREETGIAVHPAALREVRASVVAYEGRDDHCTVFELELDELPTLAIDRREVVAAWLCPAPELERCPMVPHLRSYIANLGR